MSDNLHIEFTISGEGPWRVIVRGKDASCFMPVQQLAQLLRCDVERLRVNLFPDLIGPKELARIDRELAVVPLTGTVSFGLDTDGRRRQVLRVLRDVVRRMQDLQFARDALSSSLSSAGDRP